MKLPALICIFMLALALNTSVRANNNFNENNKAELELDQRADYFLDSIKKLFGKGKKDLAALFSSNFDADHAHSLSETFIQWIGFSFDKKKAGELAENLYQWLEKYPAYLTNGSIDVANAWSLLEKNLMSSKLFSTDELAKIMTGFLSHAEMAIKTSKYIFPKK